MILFPASFAALLGVLLSQKIAVLARHQTLGKTTICFNRTLTAINVASDKEWEICTRRSNNENESYVNSMWRVYTCFLKKYLGSQETINSWTFTKVMTSKYPAEIQTSIRDEVKFESNAANVGKTWRNSEIEFSDYNNIDNMRADYYNIEKKVCGEPDAIPAEDIGEKKWDSCSQFEEFEHRSADCCGNVTLPFYDHRYGPYLDWKPTFCKKTLKKKLDTLGLKDEEDKNVFSKVSVCLLHEKNHTTIDELIKIRVDKVIETDKIVEDFVPPYVSLAVVERMMKANVVKYFNQTYIMEDLIPRTYLSKKARPEDLFGCYAYGNIFALASRAL